MEQAAQQSRYRFSLGPVHWHRYQDPQLQVPEGHVLLPHQVEWPECAQATAGSGVATTKAAEPAPTTVSPAPSLPRKLRLLTEFARALEPDSVIRSMPIGLLLIAPHGTALLLCLVEQGLDLFEGVDAAGGEAP